MLRVAGSATLGRGQFELPEVAGQVAGRLRLRPAFTSCVQAACQVTSCSAPRRTVRRGSARSPEAAVDVGCVEPLLLRLGRWPESGAVLSSTPNPAGWSGRTAATVRRAMAGGYRKASPQQGDVQSGEGRGGGFLLAPGRGGRTRAPFRRGKWGRCWWKKGGDRSALQEEPKG